MRKIAIVTGVITVGVTVAFGYPGIAGTLFKPEPQPEITGEVYYDPDL
jgi:hypothetical protein